MNVCENETLKNNYIPCHIHTEDSLLDSVTNYKLYIDKCVELGIKAICFTEHGNIYNYIEKKMYCDENAIKYIHGCEIYLTKQLEPKVRDNYHTILISKNFEGFKELNSLIDLSTQEDHFYYKPRISFDEFLNISDNIIKISACLASPLQRLDRDDSYYITLAQKYDFYEIQPHISIDQANYNQHLYNLSQKYNKPLICGTDTHSIDKYKAECRSILQKAKNIEYDNEDKYDLTFKSYDEVLNMFKEQNALPQTIYQTALDNTNLLYDLCDDVKLDLSYKYPKLYNNDEEVLKKTILDKYNYKLQNGIIDDNPRYIENIREELRVFNKIGMISFMLFMSELCTWCRENNIPVGFCRGSVGGSTIAYITDIIDVDPIKWNTVFSRFANEDRIEIGDIDCDFAPKDRDKVYQYIINRFGIDKTAYILAMTTIADKGTIDEIGRALNYDLSLVDEIKELFGQNEDTARNMYPDLFYYFNGLVGTTISQSMHPAGIVVAPISLSDNYGTFWCEGKRILQVNMEEVHEVNLVKYDILGLNNIGIIKDTYKLINSHYLLSHEIDWEDKDVWNDIPSSSVGIN
jgi:DNA polymerase-3 subunit alpha